jgi:DNA-directed RNA polymerase subunit RPC12/RpoP
LALLNCPDCGTKVSDKAASCIKCGRPFIDIRASKDPHSLGFKTHEEWDRLLQSATQSRDKWATIAGGLLLVIVVSFIATLLLPESPEALRRIASLVFVGSIIGAVWSGVTSVRWGNLKVKWEIQQDSEIDVQEGRMSMEDHEATLRNL